MYQWMDAKEVTPNTQNAWMYEYVGAVRGHSEKLGIDFDDDICEITFDGFKWHLLLDYDAKIKVVKWMALGSLHRDDWVEEDLDGAVDAQIESEKSYVPDYLSGILSNENSVDTQTIANDYGMTVPEFNGFLNDHSLIRKDLWTQKDRLEIYFAMKDSGFCPIGDNQL